jgi:hypothetical protein
MIAILLIQWWVNCQALLLLGPALCARQGHTGLDQVGNPGLVLALLGQLDSML